MLGEEQRCSSSTSGGGKGGYWFLPCSDCARLPCSHVLPLPAGSAALPGSDIPAGGTGEEDRKLPWWGCPSPSLSIAAAGSLAACGPLLPWALGRWHGLCVCHRDTGNWGRGWPGPAHDGSSERAEQRDKERRRADLILYINTLYNLGKAQC